MIKRKTSGIGLPPNRNNLINNNKININNSSRFSYSTVHLIIQSNRLHVSDRCYHYSDCSVPLNMQLIIMNINTKSNQNWFAIYSNYRMYIVHCAHVNRIQCIQQQSDKTTLKRNIILSFAHFYLMSILNLTPVQ